MKIPNSGSGNGYYGHESAVISYLDNVEAEVNAQSPSDDFSEYMWMENEEEFDIQVLLNEKWIHLWTILMINIF